MEIKDFVTFVENGEEKILEHLNNNKVVFVERINDENQMERTWDDICYNISCSTDYHFTVEII